MNSLEREFYQIAGAIQVSPKMHWAEELPRPTRETIVNALLTGRKTHEALRYGRRLRRALSVDWCNRSDQEYKDIDELIDVLFDFWEADK